MGVAPTCLPPAWCRLPSARCRSRCSTSATRCTRRWRLGYQVENPAEHGEIPGFEWADYLRLDLQKLLTCQAIALLPGWMDSKGARLEFTVATNLGMRALHAEHITGPAEILK